MNWQLQEAKNKLSKVVHAAQEDGPQVITLRGKETAVVLSMDEYKRLTGKGESFAEFMARSPLRGSGIKIERSKDTGRDIEL